MTGIGSYQHWAKPTHRTAAMDIGVWGNVAFFALGLAALYSGLAEDSPRAHSKKVR